MSKHFVILSLGSVVFLAVLFTQLRALDVSSGFNTAILTATSEILTAMKAFGCYWVFAVLVLGHGVLHHGKRRKE